MNYNKLEILLIEDNPNDAELVMDAFKSRNLVNEIILLDDGEKAVDFLFNDGENGIGKMSVLPKLILLDLKLPKIDGIEILKKLKNDNRTKMIPVVVMTSSKEESDIVKSYQLGVNSYIVKPVDFDEFAKSVAELGLYWILSNVVPY